MSIADLRSALDYIKDNPREHDQTIWICGTAACLAGHIALRAGWRPRPLHLEDDSSAYVAKDGHWGLIADVACGIVGIREEEGAVLWRPSRSIEALEMYVQRLQADQGIYSTLYLKPKAYDHAWTDYNDRVMVAVQRRTSYFRLGGTVEIKDWDSQRDAMDYALDLSTGRRLTRHDQPPVVVPDYIASAG